MRSLARCPWPPLAAAAGLFWLAAVGCQGAAPPAAASKETPDAPKHDRPALAAKGLDRGDEADRKALVQSINAFALDLYGRVGQADKNANVFLSPYSVATALGMTYPGAAGDTAQEMEKTLHFTLPPAKLQAAFADLDAGPGSTLGGKPTRFHYRLGLVVAEKDGAVKIAKVIPGTPAEKAGLQPGQQVVAIDDRPIAGGVDYAHALDLAGPTIKVEVRDGDKGKAVDVALANPPPPPQYQLAVANALWGQKGVAFKPEFVKAAQVAFQARVEEVDFVKKPDEAVKTVND